MRAIKLIEYVRAGLVAALPAIALALNHHTPEPQLRPISNPDAMVWSYPSEFQSRNFYDTRPFGSLDEVVYRTYDGNVVKLRNGDEGFTRHERVYNIEIIPFIRGEKR